MRAPRNAYGGLVTETGVGAGVRHGDVEMKADAWAGADAAARRAQVTIRELTTLDEMRGAGQLFIEVWQTPGGCPEISADLLRALQLTGGYIAGAFEAGAPQRLAGASVAFGSVRAVRSRPSSIRT